MPEFSSGILHLGVDGSFLILYYGYTFNERGDQMQNKCKGSGMSGLMSNEKLIDGTHIVCKHCGRKLKVRISNGGHDGWINNRPKFFTVPTHKHTK